MKVGLFITNQQTLDTDMVSALDDQFAMVRLARDCGWDSLFSGQHYLNEGNNKQLQTVPLLARLPAGKIPGLCQVGAGQSHARRHRLQSPARRVDQAAVHPWLARGLLRRAQALLARVRRQSHYHPHALGGDAIIHLTREHASDLGRATTCAAWSIARSGLAPRQPLSILPNQMAVASTEVR